MDQPDAQDVKQQHNAAMVETKVRIAGVLDFLRPDGSIVKVPFSGVVPLKQER